MRSGLLFHRHGLFAVTEFFTIQKKLSKTKKYMAKKTLDLRPYVRTDNSTLVSVRLNPKVVKALDKYCQKFPIYNRSILINRLLYDCLALAKPETFRNLVMFDNPDPNKWEIVIQDIIEPSATL